MALRPEARAIFLYAPLESFLISVARKGLGCRLWARELLEGQLRDGYVDLGFSSGDYFRQTDLQVAAVGWLAQHMAFRRLAAVAMRAISSSNSFASMVRPLSRFCRTRSETDFIINPV